jgi:hypothetical protein
MFCREARQFRNRQQREEERATCCGERPAQGCHEVRHPRATSVYGETSKFLNM